MTTELEEQFFKVFEIEPFCDLPCNKRGVECTDNTYCGNKYPEITDRVLLELICLLSQYFYLFEDLHVKTVSELKDCVLQKCITTIIDDTDEIHEIQQLFKERK